MKRKLDENDVPTTEAHSSSQVVSAKPSFGDLNLDPRLLQAIAKSKFSEPTQVQAKVIPLAREGKNVLARSETGSGKTVAFAVPCIETILQARKTNSKTKRTTILVLVPSIPLSDQVTRVFAELSQFCGKEIRILNLAQKASDAVMASKLQDTPDVIVSTPSKVAHFLETLGLDLSGVEKLVVDEVDLVFDYGQEQGVATIAQALPAGIQVIVVSATLDQTVEDQFRAIFTREYEKVDINDTTGTDQKVKQYVVKCGEEDKFLILYVVFKLKLVDGKSIIFVQDVDRSYRLKLYLEQFGIKSCVLNSELPVNSRLHAVQEFNKGLYNILIAADDLEVIGGIKRKSTLSEQAAEEVDGAENSDEEQTLGKQKKSKRKDFGISRGIDFQNVAYVINFDLPTSAKSYTHRIGRTARAGKSGVAISFVIPKDEFGKHKYTTISSSRHDERILEKIKVRQEKKGKQVLDYDFKMSQAEGFRYRMQDALKAVTQNKVREARTREIKQELLKSEKLAKHFEDNPDDLKALRHDTNSSAGVIKVQSHMKHVPDYLLPGGKRQKLSDAGFVKFNKDSRGQSRRGGHKGRGGRPQGRKLDPLKSFTAKRK